MAKEREDRKKEKKEKKEREEKKLRKAKELEAKKKISKKRTKVPEKSKKKSKKSDSDVEEKPRKKSKKYDSDEEDEKPRKKKSKKSDSDEEEEKSDSDEEVKPRKKSKQSDSDEEEEKPHKKSKKSDSDDEEEKPRKKSKESKKKKQKRAQESDDEPPQTQIVRSDPVTIPVATNESDSDVEFDKEDIKHLLESYSKEELINLIYKTAEKGSRLVSAVMESANRDTTKRNIFVRGLGWDTTHENLKAAFQVYGEIEECSVVMDKDTGKAKGYGFVLFKTRKGAREALKVPEKRMYNRTVSCNMAKPSGAVKPREPVESVKIDLTHTASQSEVALPGLDLGHGHSNGVDKGHPLQNMPMYAGQNMPLFGQPPGYNPMMYGAMMGNQMVAGLPSYRMFGPGMVNQGPPNHMGMVGSYGGEGNGVPSNHMGMVGSYGGEGNGAPSFDDERAWYLR